MVRLKVVPIRRTDVEETDSMLCEQKLTERLGECVSSHFCSVKMFNTDSVKANLLSNKIIS